MVPMGDSSINSAIKHHDFESIETEMIRNSTSPQCSQFDSPCTLPATLKERNIVQKHNEIASSPISKKDRILQSIAAASPKEESSDVDLKEKDGSFSAFVCRKRPINKLDFYAENERTLEKRSRNPSEPVEEPKSDCKWILVGKNGQVLIEAVATKSKIVSFCFIIAIVASMYFTEKNIQKRNDEHYCIHLCKFNFEITVVISRWLGLKEAQPGFC